MYRASLDEQVVLRQDAGLGTRLHGKYANTWNSACISADQPTVQLPFCILEVKIAKGHEESGVDAWVWQLVKEGKVLVENKFSKYGAGCSLFYPSAKYVKSTPLPGYMDCKVGEYLRSETNKYRENFASNCLIGHVASRG